MLIINKYSKYELGFTLLELSVSLAIASVLIVLQLRQASEDVRQQHLLAEGQWVAGMLGDIAQNFINSASYGALSDASMQSYRSVPPLYKIKNADGTAAITNGFGGQVHVASLSLNGGNDSYAVTYSGVPREACSQMVAILYKSSAAGGVPLFGIVGDVGVVNSVPTSIGLMGGGISLGSVGAGEQVLMASPEIGINMSQVGLFCDSASGSTAGRLSSLTIIRKP